MATSPSHTAAAPTLPAATRMGAVELTVTDLERTIAFYSDVIGLRVHRREDAVAAMGDGEEELLVFVQRPDARRAGRHAGLYHVALLYPSRLELSRAALRVAVTRSPIQGASDHQTHEAIYLPDPDGNGLELAADRPREQWPDVRDGRLFAGGPQPLDVDGLLSLVDGEQPQPRAEPGVRVGHVHLHVADVGDAMRFYRDVIGFDAMVSLPVAGFVSAGGYHHHVAFNTWRGEGVSAAPADAVGLRHFTVLLPSAADVDAVRARVQGAGLPADARGSGFFVRDPAGNRLLVDAS